VIVSQSPAPGCCTAAAKKGSTVWKLPVAGSSAQAFRGIAPPYNRKLASWTCYYRANDPELADAFREPNPVDASSFDAEASFDLIGDINTSVSTK